MEVHPLRKWPLSLQEPHAPGSRMTLLPPGHPDVTQDSAIQLQAEGVFSGCKTGMYQLLTLGARGR